MSPDRGEGKGRPGLPAVAAAVAQCVANAQAAVRNLQQQWRHEQRARRLQAASVVGAVAALQAVRSARSASAAVALGGPAGAHPAPAGGGGGKVSKDEVGRATWIFLHTLAAQYPDSPSRQQQRDVRNLVDILTRMYPCAECAAHFRALVAASPPDVGSRTALQRWMCEAHNGVNRRLGKPTFNCALVEARWGGLDCEEGDAGCSLALGARQRGGAGR
eukprot:scaffold6.g2557.t1